MSNNKFLDRVIISKGILLSKWIILEIVNRYNNNDGVLDRPVKKTKMMHPQYIESR